MVYEENNVFHKIIKKEIPTDFLIETPHSLVFRDIYPAAKIHLLVIPKGLYSDFSHFIEEASIEENLDFWSTVESAIKLENLCEKGGYRLITNKGKIGQQMIPHWHVHIMGEEIFVRK